MFLSFVLLGVVSAQRFNCKDFDVPPAPANVSMLHPGHVEFVMAMGDSITAAFAARGTIFEDRDISWAIGTGSADQLTLPYMLQQYGGHATPQITVKGQSTKKEIPPHPFDLPHHDYRPLNDHMNVAESSGAIHRGSLDEQWGYLETAKKEYLNFEKGWKVLTVWMTANDVCGECNGPMDTKKWTKKMNELLSNATSTYKNVYINLISTLDLSNIHRIQRTDAACSLIHDVVHECGCIDVGNSTQLKQLDANIHTINGILHTLAQNWTAQLKADKRTDVAVVVQSFQEGIGASLTRSFLSKLDCFHPSTEGHESLAIGLWNSMLCVDNRVNRCGIHFSPTMPVTCPTKDSVFYTGPDVTPNPPPEV
jgi:hypothetical protein